MKKFIFLFLFCTLSLFSNEFEDEFESEFSAPKKHFDPLSGYNKMMTKSNDFTFTHIIKPTSYVYTRAVGRDIRISIDKFFENLKAPIRIINNFLQGKFKNTKDEIVRFGLNSIFGIGGLGDPAKDIFNISQHDEDFGQTLGYYGVGSGFAITLPFLGPSNLRDVIGLGGDLFANPITYVNPQSASFGISAFSKYNYATSHVNEYESLKKDAISLYPFLQDVYESYRDELIKN